MIKKILFAGLIMILMFIIVMIATMIYAPCVKSEKEHNNHKTITYGSIMPDVDEVKKEVKDLN